MNVIDRLVANRVYLLVEAEKQQIRIDAQNSGFELGKEAQKELFLETGVLKGTEQEHMVKCVNCKTLIHLPCANIVFPGVVGVSLPITEELLNK